ncbi:MAG: site-2 protease family protein [Anaerolineales bacterium]|nr:site-2 protease family protein [Anaerolineales bacterium]
MAPTTIADFICRVLILLVVFPAHELAHALTATAMGDPTPRAHGRLTLNPIKHLDLWGSMLFVFYGIGWASTPVNPAYFGENRRMKMGLLGLSGPMTNLVLGFLGAVPFYLFGWLPTLVLESDGILPNPEYFFTIFIFLNLLLAFFNLIPIAPLDGAQVLGALLPESIAAKYDSLQRYGMYALIVLLFALPMAGFSPLDWIIQYLIGPIMQLLFSGLGTAAPG